LGNSPEMHKDVVPKLCTKTQAIVEEPNRTEKREDPPVVGACAEAARKGTVRETRG